MKARRKIFKLMVLNKNGYKVIKFIANYLFQLLAMPAIKYQFNVKILEGQAKPWSRRIIIFRSFFSPHFYFSIF